MNGSCPKQQPGPRQWTNLRRKQKWLKKINKNRILLNAVFAMLYIQDQFFLPA